MATKTKDNEEIVEEIVETTYSFTQDELEALIKKTTEDALKDYISRTEDPGITLGQKGVMNPAQLAAQTGAEVVVVSEKKSLLKRAYEKVAKTVYEHPVATVMLSAAAGCAGKMAWDKAHAGTDTDSIALPTDDNAFGGYMPQ